MRFTGSRFESSYHQFCTPATPRQVEMQEICGMGGLGSVDVIFFLALGLRRFGLRS
jgi:hypothetical protein